MTNLGPRPTMSTARAAELIGTAAKNVAAMWRAGELGGYAIRTRPGSRVHKIRIYTDSVAAYQQRAEQDNPLRGIA